MSERRGEAQVSEAVSGERGRGNEKAPQKERRSEQAKKRPAQDAEQPWTYAVCGTDDASATTRRRARRGSN
jgi:hypothetical protein